MLCPHQKELLKALLVPHKSADYWQGFRAGREHENSRIKRLLLPKEEA